MNKICLFVHILFLSLVVCSCNKEALHNPSNNFDISFEPESHYINVDMNLVAAPKGTTTLKMPVWAPGYYLILDSPKHVSQFKVTDCDGYSIPWKKEGKNTWIIDNGNRRNFTVSYRIYANNQSVGEAYVDSLRAYLPGNEVYLYRADQKFIPSNVTIHIPPTWSKACSGLSQENDSTFYARDFDTLVDTPIYVGNPTVHNFEFDGHQYTICLGDDKGVNMNYYEFQLKKMIEAATELMGDVPYENYCFLWLWDGRGGLEHLNSQACFTEDDLYSHDRDAHRKWMNFVTHEYFHLYNVKSIRPFELGPFNYDGECFTDQLWISEGLTCFYEHVLMRRAGLSSPEEMVQDWMEYVRDTETNPGRANMSLSQSSYDIWLNFFNADPSTDRISYYVKGPVVGLLMDLAIRQATNNQKSMDDLMRQLYQKYYKEQKRGFHPEEFWAVAQKVAGDNNLEDVKSMVYTTDEIDYDKFLGYAGLRLDRKNWTLVCVDNPTPEQMAIRNGVFGDYKGSKLKE